jgi:hypothetical protein
MTHGARFVLVLLVGLAVFAGFMAMVLSHAKAQAVLCMPERAMLDMLMQRFDEHVIVRADQRIILTRSHAGTWSLLKVDKSIACMSDSGINSEVERGV